MAAVALFARWSQMATKDGRKEGSLSWRAPASSRQTERRTGCSLARSYPLRADDGSQAIYTRLLALQSITPPINLGARAPCLSPPYVQNVQTDSSSDCPSALSNVPEEQTVGLGVMAVPAVFFKPPGTSVSSSASFVNRPHLIK